MKTVKTITNSTKIKGKVICNACRGSGKNTSNNVTMKCGKCGGKGVTK